VLVAVLSAGGTVLADVNMQEGNWETTIETKMEMEGMPFPLPPMTYKVSQCLTKKEMVPNTAKKDQKCEVKNQKITGNTVTWQVVCVDKDGKSEGDGAITYAGNSYDGAIKMKITTKDSPKPMRMNIKMNGKRIGNCTK